MANLLKIEIGERLKPNLILMANILEIVMGRRVLISLMENLSEIEIGGMVELF